VFPPPYPSEVILDRLAAIGYTSLDIGLDYCVGKGDLLDGDNWRERVMALRRQADALGVIYTHSHAPGNAGNRSEAQMRAFEAAALLGARYIVVHPIHEMGGQIITDDAEFIRINREATLPLLPIAEKLGLTILSENILWGSSIYPRNIVELVKAVDSPYFGWCFDSGHANFYGITPSVLRELDVVPLSLHIQDTHGPGSGDEHLLPGDGSIDWKEFLHILRDIGYQGELVLEAHHQSYDAPDEEKDGILTELLRRAERMLAYYQSL
jgi:sugar phosphate isomerase/epimerase